jgi:hypothetical protein
MEPYFCHLDSFNFKRLRLKLAAVNADKKIKPYHMVFNNFESGKRNKNGIERMNDRITTNALRTLEFEIAFVLKQTFVKKIMLRNDKFYMEKSDASRARGNFPHTAN